MITKLILDAIGTTLPGGHETELLRSGLPIALLDFVSGDKCLVRLPDDREVVVEAATVDGHEPEETLSALANEMGIAYPTLLSAVQQGRVLARKSGGVWLSTRAAVEAAGIKSRKEQ